MPARLLRIVGALAVIGLVGFAGFHVGRWLRPAQSQGPGIDPSSALRLVEGGPFPDLALLGQDGDEVRSSELLVEHGAIVLVIDLDCPPCGELTGAWQAALDEATLADGQYADQLDPRLPILGITVSPVERIAAYRERQGLSFPIYGGAGKALAEEHGVIAFPLQIVVGRTGNIRSLAFSAEVNVDEALWLLTQ